MLDNATAIAVGYAGSYSNHLPLSENAAAVPPQYWNFTRTQNQAVANLWNANVSNPFYLGNFSSLQSSNLQLYQHMSNNAFFTSKTIAQSNGAPVPLERTRRPGSSRGCVQSGQPLPIQQPAQYDSDVDPIWRHDFGEYRRHPGVYLPGEVLKLLIRVHPWP